MARISPKYAALRSGNVGDLDAVAPGPGKPPEYLSGDLLRCGRPHPLGNRLPDRQFISLGDLRLSSKLATDGRWVPAEEPGELRLPARIKGFAYLAEGSGGHSIPGWVKRLDKDILPYVFAFSVRVIFGPDLSFSHRAAVVLSERLGVLKALIGGGGTRWASDIDRMAPRNVDIWHFHFSLFSGNTSVPYFRYVSIGSMS